MCDGGPAGLSVRDRDGSVHRYKKKWHTEYETCTKTVMVREPVTNYVERQRVVCKPVYDTIEVPCQRVVCKPIHETGYVTQTYTVCKPVQTTQQVTTYCMQPTTQLVTVPTATGAAFATRIPAAARPWPAPPTRRPGRQGRGLHHDGPRDPDPPGAGHPDPVRAGSGQRRQEDHQVPDGPGSRDPEGPLRHLDLRAQDRHQADPPPGLRAGGGDLLQAGHPDGPVQLRDRPGGPGRPVDAVGPRRSGQAAPAAPSKQSTPSATTQAAPTKQG